MCVCISFPRFLFRFVLQSVILLTRLPFINLYYEILSLIAPKYFAGGETVLQNVCTDISNWPPIQAGECIQLSLLDTIFQTYIPSLTSANLQQAYISSNTQSTKSTPPATASSSNSVESDSSTPASPSNATANSTNISMDNECPANDTTPTNSQWPSVANESNAPATQSILDEQSRQDILDNYKQSKEMLLVQTNSTKRLESNGQNCDSESGDTHRPCDANDALDNDNTNNGDIDEEFDRISDIKFSDKSDNTQSGHSTKIERPLHLLQTSNKTPIVLSSVNEIDIFRSICTVLPYTHLLWELVLTAEPIVVMSTSPSDCSHMVQTLMRYATERLHFKYLCNNSGNGFSFI